MTRKQFEREIPQILGSWALEGMEFETSEIEQIRRVCMGELG